MTRTRLIVFARLPQLGRVKTRLAATIGPQRALEVYRRLLDTTLALAQASGADRLELCVADDGVPADDGSRTLTATLAARGWTVVPQRGADLGARMRDALERALEQGERPVLLGSDCPVLSPADVQAAFAALRRADAVFAPTEDGGYALVGLSRPLPTLFEHMPWGTGEVAARTRERAHAVQARVAWLRTVWDVDVEADLVRWERGAGGGPAAAD
ncbi:MAG: glycosyltransferase [Burkholderiales bacterium]|nr:MAG: glycosyltransferase [Burkholderiales bacterium]